jgi:2-keto-myo-inositol isomerase
LSHLVTFALNHMVAPRRSVAELVALARELGLDAIEIRNDLAGVAIADGTPAAAVREAAEDGGVRILSINALQRFNDWTPARAEEARSLAAYAKGCGAEALVLCPVNDRGWQPSDSERQAKLKEALRGLGNILGEAGITGLVEPLGFEESSLRLKQDAVEAIEELDLGDRFRLVHDTFHHYLSGEPRMFPEHTGLVHISGVEDASLPLERLRDEHRVLIGPDDLSTSLLQILGLMEGYSGAYSFEPFAVSVHEAGDIAGALERSMDFIDREIARLPA